MKRLILPLLLSVCLPAAVRAQSPEEVLHLLDSCRVSASYSFLYNDLRCSGSVVAQKPFYKVSTGGMEIYCDGHCRWTVDRKEKEVYVEAAEGEQTLRKYMDRLKDVRLYDVKTAAPDADVAMFRFDVSSLGPDWVVTDLR